MTDLIPLTLVISIFVISIFTSASVLGQVEKDTITPLINSYNECLNNDDGNDCITHFFHECNELNRKKQGLIIIDCEGLFIRKIGSYSDLWGED